MPGGLSKVTAKNTLNKLGFSSRAQITAWMWGARLPESFAYMRYEARFAHRNHARRGHRPARPRHRTGRPSTIQLLTRTSDHEIAGARNGPGHYFDGYATAPRQIRQRPRSLTTRIAANRARTTLPLAMVGHPASGSANGDKRLSASARSHHWPRCLCPHDR